jgi:myo-inositol-1(or 4)-monophosphatase
VKERERVLELAVALARGAGGIQLERYETDLRIGSKSSAVDLVTEVDHACEAHIVAGIQAARPGDAIVAEEGSGDDHPDATWRWIIDPLDGTVNYAHGYPCFCVSIGVEHEGERALGVVYNPLLDELYHALRGGGAFRNGRPIRVSRRRELGQALVATGFAYDRRESELDNVRQFTAVLKSAGGLRRGGAAALDLCHVACGRLEAFWELKLHAWDVAAGILLVEEAGGRCSALGGGPAPRDGHEIVASNAAVHEALLAVLARS